METTTQRPTYDITVDWKLLDHYDHLPETIECICGYVREEA